MPLTEQSKNRLARFIVVIPMVAIAFPICWWGHRVWTDHWLARDAQPTSAIVTGIHPKRVYDYRYTIDGKEYSGTSQRDWENEKVHTLQAGEQTTVSFSTSHPWLSSMLTTRVAWAGLPFTVLMLLIECFLLAVLIDPHGKWAITRWLLNPNGK